MDSTEGMSAKELGHIMSMTLLRLIQRYGLLLRACKAAEAVLDGIRLEELDSSADAELVAKVHDLLVEIIELEEVEG